MIKRVVRLASLICAVSIPALASPQLHAGGSLGLGVAVPLQNASAGFKLGLKGWFEVPFGPVSLGLALPVQFGFYGGSSGFVNTSFNAIDILPSARAAFPLGELVQPYFELGVGPSVLMSSVDLRPSGINIVNSSSQTFVALRIAAGVEITPPSLKGLLFGVEAAGFNVRFGNGSFAEYVLLFSVGYRA
ncbi:MAG: outer membrane beta-barrel protein [Myxococcaceae bacterium]